MAITTGRVKREHRAHFIKVNPGGATPVLERLGSGNDTLSRTKNMSVEKVRDVTGDSEINVTRGDEEVDITPYYAKRGTGLFDMLLDFDQNDRELDELLTTYYEVDMWEDENGDVLNTATERECFVEITEVGGDTTGFQIPFNLHLRGTTTKGTWTPGPRVNGVETGTFTPTV